MNTGGKSLTNEKQRAVLSGCEECFRRPGVCPPVCTRVSLGTLWGGPRHHLPWSCLTCPLLVHAASMFVKVLVAGWSLLIHKMEEILDYGHYLINAAGGVLRHRGDFWLLRQKEYRCSELHFGVVLKKSGLRPGA